MRLATIYADKQFLCKRPAASIGGLGFEFISTFWVCPQCAEVWAVEMPEGSTSYHSSQVRSCAKHGNGSLLYEFDWNLYLDRITPQKFPKPLMLREFKLCLKHDPRYRG